MNYNINMEPKPTLTFESDKKPRLLKLVSKGSKKFADLIRKNSTKIYGDFCRKG